MLRYLLCAILVLSLVSGFALAADEASPAPVKTATLALVAVQTPPDTDLALSSGILNELLKTTFKQPVTLAGQQIQLLSFFVHMRSPIVLRAMSEGAITLEDCKRIYEPRRAVKLGIAIGADYVLVPRVINCSASEGQDGWKAKVVLGMSLIAVAPNTDECCLVPTVHIEVAFTGLAAADSGEQPALTKETAVRTAVNKAYHTLLQAMVGQPAPAQ